VEKVKEILREIFLFFSSRIFLKNFGILAALSILLLMIVRLWLSFYTKHNTEVEVEKFINLSFEDGLEVAKESSVRLTVSDSFFRVGSPGGIILEQNPLPGSFVKENRNIYVKVSKHVPDQVRLDDLPLMYGKEYRNISRLLETRYDVSSSISGRRFDKGPPDHILAVYYKGEEVVNRYGRKKNIYVDRGGEMEFLLSQRSVASMNTPDLTCKTLDEAKLILSTYQLELKELKTLGTISDPSSAYVHRQSPSAGNGSTIRNGDSMTLYITQEKPESCF
jgi:beta-lactam-binding protein with PASTA domain